MPEEYIELATGFSVTGSVDFPNEGSISIDHKSLARLVHDWIDEHPKETPGGGDRPHRKFRIVVEAVD